MYVVKDLVPDLTFSYKQYKSIKPYLQRESLPSDVSLLYLPRLTKVTPGFYSFVRGTRFARARTSDRN